MPGVVVTGGALTCADGGKAAMTSTVKLTVGQVPVVIAANLGTFTPYTACNFKTPNGTPKMCAATTVVSGGTAQKLTAGNQAVLLDDLQAKTDNLSAVSLSAGETKLTAK
jgi:hypothetical protein